jgi:hypothetical protein
VQFSVAALYIGIVFFGFFSFAVLGIEFRASHMPGKRSSHTPSPVAVFKILIKTHGLVHQVPC